MASGSAPYGDFTVAAATSSAPASAELTRAAQDAYAARDVAASIEVHQQKKALQAPELHGGAGGAAADYIKSIVFGGLDGIITTFAVVSSVVGASLPIEIVILSGFAKLLGDGLAMGLGDCMSEAAEQQHVRGERAREAWEFANHPEGEVAEMVDIYVSRGFSRPDAEKIIGAMTGKKAYADYFVDHMLTQELGLMLPGEDDNPVKDGAVTFLSFMVFGSIPLWAYVIFYGAKYNDIKGQFGICIAITILLLFALGAMQAWIIRQSLVKQGVLMMINGSLAAAAAYLIGWGLQEAVGGGVCG